MLYRRKCYDGEDCPNCKWDEEKEQRVKMPALPPCFAASMGDTMDWEQFMLESSDSSAASYGSCPELDEGSELSESEDEKGSDEDDEEEKEGEDDEAAPVVGERNADDEAAAVEGEGGSDGEGVAVKAKRKKKTVMMTVEGSQTMFHDHYVESMEKGLAHSARCIWTNHCTRRRVAHRPDWEVIVRTDFSATFELRPGKTECCKFYHNVALVPFYVHYTDGAGVRKTDAIIVCSADLANNFAVYRHLLRKVIEKYTTGVRTVPVKRVTVLTDNCRKQYRNRMNYGFVADYLFSTGIEMELFFEEQYHGKCIVDAICALLKIMARKEAVTKDSIIARKGMIHTYEKLAEFGRTKFEGGKEGKTSVTDNFEFWTLGKATEGESEVGGGFCAGAVNHSSVPDYEVTVKYDLQRHNCWACKYCAEPGDLRARDWACACGPCIDGNRYECEVAEETGPITKFYVQPSLKDAVRDKQRADFLVALGEAHCRKQLPLLWPDRRGEDLTCSYAYWIGIPACNAAEAAAAAAKFTKASAKGVAHGAGGNHARPAASKLPVHMYWRYHTKKQSWMPCVHVTRWFQASNPGELVLHQSKTKGGQVHIAWAHEVPPVELLGWQQWADGASSADEITISADAGKQIRMLNLLRFNMKTQVV